MNKEIEQHLELWIENDPVKDLEQRICEIDELIIELKQLSEILGRGK
mgnify:CR=1 FL=1